MGRDDWSYPGSPRWGQSDNREYGCETTNRAHTTHFGIMPDYTNGTLPGIARPRPTQKQSPTSLPENVGGRLGILLQFCMINRNSGKTGSISHHCTWPTHTASCFLRFDMTLYLQKFLKKTISGTAVAFDSTLGSYTKPIAGQPYKNLTPD